MSVRGVTAYSLVHATARALYSTMLTPEAWNALIQAQDLDAAITNLDERVDQLWLQYHAIRQESITRQVLEVQSNTQARYHRRAIQVRDRLAD